MERPKRGIVVEDLEKPLRFVLKEFVRFFEPVYKNSSEKITISFAFVKLKEATISIDFESKNRIEYNHPTVDDSWGSIPLNRLFNDTEAVCDEIISIWKQARISNPQQSNAMSNKISFELLNFKKESKYNIPFFNSVLNSQELNLKKIKMYGVCDSFYKFNNMFVNPSERIFTGSMDYEKFCADVLTALVNKNGLSFKDANMLDVESFFSKKEIKTHISDDLIELAFSDMSKNGRSYMPFLYESLSKLVDISKVKTKEFKSLNQAKSLGDSSSILAETPSNVDSFFLSRVYIENSLSFNLPANKKYTDSDYKKNIDFIFNILARKDYQPLTGITSANVQEANNMLFLVVGVNEKKYKRENFLSEVNDLVVFLNKLTQQDPLSSTGLLEDYMKGSTNKNFAGWQKDMLTRRENCLKEFIGTKKNKLKIEKIFSNHTESVEHGDRGDSVGSFKI